MRWEIKNTPSRITTWHQWFAWYPVEIDGEAIWLEKVWRKGTEYYGGFGDCVVDFEYSFTGETP